MSENPHTQPKHGVVFSDSFRKVAKRYSRNHTIASYGAGVVFIPIAFASFYLLVEKSSLVHRSRAQFLKQRALGECIVEQIRSLEVLKNRNGTLSLAPYHLKLLEQLKDEQENGADFSVERNIPSQNRDMQLLTQFLQQRLNSWTKDEQHEIDSTVVDSVCNRFTSAYQMSCKAHFEMFYPELLESAIQDRIPQTMYVESFLLGRMTPQESVAWVWNEVLVTVGWRKRVHRYWAGEDEV